MPSAVTDLTHGRQGGRWLPPGYTPPVVRTCPVCAGPMYVEQTVHRSCEPALLTLFDGDGI